MRVDIIKTRYKDRVYTSALLRTSYREGGKLKHKTLANLSALPWDVIDMIRRSLKGEVFVPAGAAFRIVRSRMHGACQRRCKITANRRLKSSTEEAPHP
mgnify:CR=1 FL=1